MSAIAHPSDTYRDRLQIAQEDLAQAVRFGKLMLTRHSKHDPRNRESRLIYQALDIALIVAYCRPFTQFKDRRGNKEPKLSEEILSVLDEDELHLHEALLGRRHKEYAHSDASRIQLRWYPSAIGPLPVSRDRFVPLPKPRIEQLVAMSEKLYRRIEDELQSLKEAERSPACSDDK